MLAAVLRGVGLAVGLVCLYALVQALTMTARERRGAVALLRACGGDARAVATVLAGAAAAVALPAARRRDRCSSGRCSGRSWRGWPPASRRCRSPPRPATSRSCCSACSRCPPAATALVARRVLREPVVAGLREE